MFVVTKLDRLGRTARDILDTLEQFAKRNVRMIVIQFLGGQNIDMDSTVGRLVVIFFAGLVQFEADMIGERTSESLQWRQQQGLTRNHAGYGNPQADWAIIHRLRPLTCRPQEIRRK